MISISQYTNEGDRNVNEDSIGVYHNGEKTCAVLCDGLGGHGMGDVASQTVVKTFESILDGDSITDCLEKGFILGQEALLKKQEEMHAEDKMKTTCVAAGIDEKSISIGYIGDSRAYIFEKNRIRQRTVDHSVPQVLALSGMIKESEIRNHPDRNRVLRVMGGEWNSPRYEMMPPIPVKKCDALLLCSDGFWELIEEDEMCHLLKKTKSVDEWLEAMVKVVKENGKERNMDNFSAIAIRLN